MDNGNWNTRLGFTLTQSSDDIILRARFETGLGLRNSALGLAGLQAAVDQVGAHVAALVRGRREFALRHGLLRTRQYSL